MSGVGARSRQAGVEAQSVTGIDRNLNAFRKVADKAEIVYRENRIFEGEVVVDFERIVITKLSRAAECDRFKLLHEGQRAAIVAIVLAELEAVDSCALSTINAIQGIETGTNRIVCRLQFALNQLVGVGTALVDDLQFLAAVELRHIESPVGEGNFMFFCVNGDVVCKSFATGGVGAEAQLDGIAAACRAEREAVGLSVVSQLVGSLFVFVEITCLAGTRQSVCACQGAEAVNLRNSTNRIPAGEVEVILGGICCAEYDACTALCCVVDGDCIFLYDD